MRRFVAALVVVGALALMYIIGAIAFLAAGRLALHFDPSANDSHLSSFIVAITGVAVAIASAFPIFGRAVPWVAARLERLRARGDDAHTTEREEGSEKLL